MLGFNRSGCSAAATKRIRKWGRSSKQTSTPSLAPIPFCDYGVRSQVAMLPESKVGVRGISVCSGFDFGTVRIKLQLQQAVKEEHI